jgi:hypothetical protein
MKPSRSVSLSALCVAFLAASALAQSPVGTGFTYQGRLTDAGLPTNGSYDLRFTLFDAGTAGNLVGGPQTLTGVAVSQGLFSVTLDFGAAAFAGEARWLEIEVQPAGGGGYSLLSPRQELSPSPYTVFSSYTDPANLTSLNAGNLTSGTVPDARVSGAYSQAVSLPNPANAFSGSFSGDGFALTNLNASSLASGTLPDARLSGSYSSPLTLSNAGNSFSGDGSGLTNLNAQPRYVRSVVVSPVGAPAANGAALLAALASITTASASNPWLLKIEPGIYDVGAASLVMKPFVDVEGSGETVTRITGAGSASSSVGTVQGADNAELRFLSVESVGGAFATALLLDGVSTSLGRVTALATGGATESRGIGISNAASPLLRDVTASASSVAGNSRGISVRSLSTPRLAGVTAASLAGNAESVGIYYDGGSALELHEVRASATGAPAGANRAVYGNNASLEAVDLVASAYGPSNENKGFMIEGTSPTPLVLHNLLARASGNATLSVGLDVRAATVASDVRAEAFGDGVAHGVQTESAPAGTRLVHVTATAGGTGNSVGIANFGADGLILEDVSVDASGSDVVGVYAAAGTGLALAGGHIRSRGTTNAVGIYVVGESSASFTGVEATAWGPAANGVLNIGSSIQLNQAVVVADWLVPAANVIGLFNDVIPGSVSADRCTVRGATTSVSNGGNSTLLVGGSQLVGTVTTLPGSTTSCVLSYNGSYAPVNAACQ